MTIEISNGATCNLCGLSCVLGPEGAPSRAACGLIDAEVSGGYESTPGNGSGALDDCTAYRFSLCEFCLDWLFGQFRNPVRVLDMMARDENDSPPTWRPAAERVRQDRWRGQKHEFFEEQRRRDAARTVAGMVAAEENAIRAAVAHATKTAPPIRTERTLARCAHGIVLAVECSQCGAAQRRESPSHHWHRYTPSREPAFGDVVRLVGCESDHIGVVVCWTVGGASVVWRGCGLTAVGAYSAGSLEWRSAAPQDRGGR